MRRLDLGRACSEARVGIVELRDCELRISSQLLKRGVSLQLSFPVQADLSWRSRPTLPAAKDRSSCPDEVEPGQSRTRIFPGPASAVADAILEGIATGAFEVIRGGEAGARTIALKRETPFAGDDRFFGLQQSLEEAVRDQSAVLQQAFC